MRLSWRDALATIFVGAGALLYALWLAGASMLGLSSTKVLGAVILGLGLAASVTAVVYGVGAGLLQAPKLYLAAASVIGLLALVAGILVLLSGNEAMLAVLVAASVVLWLMSTLRHAMVAGEAGADLEATPQHHRHAA